jgi:hypothetical protein
MIFARADFVGVHGTFFTERSASSPDESPMQHNPANTFAGWIDLWEHVLCPQNALPIAVMIGASFIVSFLAD